MQNRIFSTDNPKASKASAYGYLNAIHYMAPASQSGVNLCPHASPGCIAMCLGWTSGQAGMVASQSDLNSVRKSRIVKAQRFMQSRADYMGDVTRSIILARRKAKREGLTLCVRMNGATDIAWEGVKAQGVPFIASNPGIQFVDYTKSLARALAHAAGKLPANYHLTFSRSETNEADCLTVLQAGGNVAVVFAGALPALWQGFPVISGDEHDLRHLDPQGGYVIGLSPKGNLAKRDTSGFVLRNYA